MSERPAITANGVIRKIRETSRLFEIEMDNGYHALAVLHHNDPEAPLSPIGKDVTVTFSPYDMTRCKIRDWIDSQPNS